MSSLSGRRAAEGNHLPETNDGQAPLAALLGLMHLRGPRAALVLAGQKFGDGAKDLLGLIVLFQQVLNTFPSK